MTEFMIALESFQDAHVYFTGENITADEIEEKYDLQLTTLNLKNLEKQLILMHNTIMLSTVGLFNPNDI